MKKIVAFALALAMVLALVPNTFATNVLGAQKSAYTPKSNFQTETAGNLAADRELPGNNAADVANLEVNEEWESIKNPSKLESPEMDFNDENFNRWRVPFPEIGYGAVFDLATDFSDMDPFFNDQTANCWGLMFYWSADETTNYVYSENDKVYAMAQLWEGFTAEDDLNLCMAVFAGDNEAEEISLAGYSINNQYVTTKHTAPADNYMYAFLLFTWDQSFNAGKIFLTGNLYEKEAANLNTTATLALGQTATLDIGGADTELFLDPFFSEVYGKAYSVDLKAGDKFTITFDGSDKIGIMAYVFNESWGLVSRTGISKADFEDGHTYDNVYLDYRTPVNEKIYIVLAGFDYSDTGTVNMKLSEYNGEWVAENINFSELNTTNVGVDGEGNLIEGAHWGYVWYAEDGVGELHIVYPGEYTFTAENPNVVVIPYDNTVMHLNGATFAGILSLAKQAPVEVNCMTDNNKIESNGVMPYALYNISSEKAFAPIYFTGMGGVDLIAPSGVELQSASLHIGCARYHATAIGGDGIEYAFATTTFEATLTLGAGATIEDDLVLATVWSDATESAVLAYSFAPVADIHNQSDEILNIAAEVTVKNSVGIRGDANGDGTVNSGDASAILRFLAKLDVIEGQNLINADYNQDGNVNSGDASGILLFLAGGAH
ncbi:MAG: dockerin type I repeat-containing protein [Clostridia bacterium]